MALSVSTTCFWSSSSFGMTPSRERWRSHHPNPAGLLQSGDDERRPVEGVRGGRAAADEALGVAQGEGGVGGAARGVGRGETPEEVGEEGGGRDGGDGPLARDDAPRAAEEEPSREREDPFARDDLAGVAAARGEDREVAVDAQLVDLEELEEPVVVAMRGSGRGRCERE